VTVSFVPVKNLCSLIVDCKNRTPPFVDFDSPYYVVRTSNIKNGRLIREGLKRTTEAAFKEWTARAVPAPGDVIITREAPLGEVCPVPSDIQVCLGQRMMLYRPDPTKLDSNYLLYALASPAVQKHLGKHKGGSTVGHARVEKVKSLPIPYVDLKVQRHIGETLATWDRAILLTSSLIERKYDRMTFLREQFLKSDESVALGTICRVNPESVEVCQELKSEFIYVDLSMVGPRRYTLPTKVIQAAEAPSRARRIARSGDILMSTVRPNLMGFAILDDLPRPVVVSTGFAVLRCESEIERQLVFESLFSKHVLDQISSKVVGSNYPAINSSDVASLNLSIPNSIEKRSKLASAFRWGDKELKLLESRLDLLKKEKAGLMQTLFPRENAS
jgi:type I restriction enzyme S subunit